MGSSQEDAMEKKKLHIIPACILGVLLLAVVTAVIGIGILLQGGYGITVGRCLVTDSGSYMLIDDNSPIVMSDRSNGQKLFLSLETGDQILVVHDGINESYPGQTGAYACLRISKGDISDIPKSVITSLTDLGWLRAEE